MTRPLARPTNLLWALAVMAAIVTGGCRRPSAEGTHTERTDQSPSSIVNTMDGQLPLHLRLPRPLRADQRYPLVVLLHGYGTDGPSAVEELGYDQLASEARLILAAPSGTRDRMGGRYWRASAACCDYFGANPDHLDILTKLIDRLVRRYPVDTSRIFVVGHSNGGHMAYALACRPSSRIAAVAVVAGALLVPRCAKGKGPSLLHVHGNADGIVPFTAATLDRPNGRRVSYPGAATSVRRFAAARGCSPRLTPDAALLAASRTVTRVHHQRCPRGSNVALWTVDGGHHVDQAFADLATRIWKWLLAHSRAPQVSQ